MATSTFTVGQTVRFKPGPRSTTYVTGTVTDLGTGANGQFMNVAVTGRDVPYKVRPGGATAV